MQALVGFALLVAGGAAAAPLASAPVLLQTEVDAGAGADARAAAWLWLRVNAWDTQPSKNALSDLAKSDPNSYAIVQALLAKKQLGVLDMRHPKDGFVAGKRAISASDEASLARMEAQVAEKPSPVEQKAATVAAPVADSYANWMNWSPNSGDDHLVAELKKPSMGAADAPTNSLISEAAQVSDGMIPDDDSPQESFTDIGGLHIPKIAWGNTHERGTDPVPVSPIVARAEAPKPKVSLAKTETVGAWGSSDGIDFSAFFPGAKKTPKQAQQPKLAMAAAKQQDLLAGFQDSVPEQQQPSAQRVFYDGPTPAQGPAPVTNELTHFNWLNANADEGLSASAKASATQTASFLKKAVFQPQAKENPYLQMAGMDQMDLH